VIKMSEYDFTKKIEDMTDEQLKERIQAAYEYEMPALKPISYIGLINKTKASNGDSDQIVYDYKELTALCPMTGIQDLYEIKISFIPHDFVPELKSLKMYYLAFRDLPISHEHLASKIYKEFESAVKPYKMNIELTVAIRGGIETIINL